MSGFNEVCTKTPTRNAERIAEIISTICQPMFVSIPVFVLLSFKAKDVAGIAISMFISLMAAVLIPATIVYGYSLKMHRKDGDIPNKKDRIIPMTIILVSYTIGSVLLFVFDAPKLVTAMMISYLIATTLATIITIKWKISLHAIGIAGMVTSLTMVYWPWGLISSLTIPPVIWARYIQKKHTPAQLAVGSLFGIVITATVLIVAGSM